MQPENKKNLLLPVLLALSFLLAILLIYQYNNSGQMTAPVNIPVKQVVPTVIQETGSIELKQIDAQTYDIIASSSGHSVVGYDIIIEYSAGSAVASSMLPDFTVVSNKVNSNVIAVDITGVKKISNKSQFVFDNKSIARLTFSNGSSSPRLVKQLGLQKTKMVDDKTKILYPVLK